jgi:hypothetical protein
MDIYCAADLENHPELFLAQELPRAVDLQCAEIADICFLLCWPEHQYDMIVAQNTLLYVCVYLCCKYNKPYQVCT